MLTEDIGKRKLVYGKHIGPNTDPCVTQRRAYKSEMSFLWISEFLFKIDHCTTEIHNQSRRYSFMWIQKNVTVS